MENWRELVLTPIARVTQPADLRKQPNSRNVPRDDRARYREQRISANLVLCSLAEKLSEPMWDTAEHR